MTYILKKKLNHNISELIEGLTEVGLFFTVYLQFLYSLFTV